MQTYKSKIQQNLLLNVIKLKNSHMVIANVCTVEMNAKYMQNENDKYQRLNIDNTLEASMIICWVYGCIHYPTTTLCIYVHIFQCGVNSFQLTPCGYGPPYIPNPGGPGGPLGGQLGGPLFIPPGGIPKNLHKRKKHH